MWVSPGSQSLHMSLGFLVQMKVPSLKAKTRQESSNYTSIKKQKVLLLTACLFGFLHILSLEDIPLKLIILSTPTVLATKKD